MIGITLLEEKYLVSSNTRQSLIGGFSFIGKVIGAITRKKNREETKKDSSKKKTRKSIRVGIKSDFPIRIHRIQLPRMNPKN